MLYEIKKRNKKVGTMRDYYTDDISVFVLDIDESVKVSNHHNEFKEWRVVSNYLDWLFGAGKWSLKECSK